MIAVRTNRGMMLQEKCFWRGLALPTNFYVALLTAETVDDPNDEEAVTQFFRDVKTMADVVEIPAGHGYTSGGYQLSRNSTDFPLATEDDDDDEAIVGLKDIVYTASGGYLPIGADSDDTKKARYAAITTDEATVADRQILAVVDLGALRWVSDGQPITLHDIELASTQPTE